MTDWTAITDPEIQPGQPAYASVAERLRDNLTALAEGDATVPEASKLTAGSFKAVTDTSQTFVLASQLDSITIPDDFDIVEQVFFQAIIMVPGDYTFAGTRSNTSGNIVKIYKNDVLVKTVSDAGFTYDFDGDLAAGDKIHVTVYCSSSFSITLSNFRLLSERAVPLCQAQFMYLEQTPE